MTTLPEPDEQPMRTQGQIIASFAGKLGVPAFPRGDLAALRRLDPDAPDHPVFWRLLMAEGLPIESLPDDAIRRWAAILHGMGLMTPNHHDGRVHVGTALHEAGIAESRLARFLEARGRQFCALLPRLCRQLAQRGQPLDWRELGRLVLVEGRNEDAAERSRLTIARHYYAAEARAGRRSADAA